MLRNGCTSKLFFWCQKKITRGSRAFSAMSRFAIQVHRGDVLRASFFIRVTFSKWCILHRQHLTDRRRDSTARFCFIHFFILKVYTDCIVIPVLCMSKYSYEGNKDIHMDKQLDFFTKTRRAIESKARREKQKTSHALGSTGPRIN